jgi:putative FmdB family regulatory protein
MTAALIMVGTRLAARMDESAPAEPYYSTVMPLYEYECRNCHHHFELLVRSQTVPACPSCDSPEVDKQLSVFAVGAGVSGGDDVPAPAPCGACGDPRGPGACSLN